MSAQTLLIARLVAFAVLLVGFFSGLGWLFSTGIIGLGAILGVDTYINWGDLTPRLRLTQCILVVLLVFLGFI